MVKQNAAAAGVLIADDSGIVRAASRNPRSTMTQKDNLPVVEDMEKTTDLLKTAHQALPKEIVGRERDEAALKQSERIYRAIGESIDYGVWVCAPDGRNTYASESFLRLVGITQEECSNFGWGKVLHPEDAERTIAAWKECVRTGGTWNIEHRFRGVDGKWHPVLARGVPVRDEQGQVTCWAGINLDISQMKEVEEKLRASEERFRRAVVRSPIPTVLHAEDGAILEISDSWCEITGYAREELATVADWTERAYGERQQLVQADIDALYRLDHRKYEGDYTIRTKSGQSRVWEFSSAPLGRLPDGRRLVISKAMDVTDRRQAEAALREAEGLYQSLVEHLPQCVFRKDREGRFTYVNNHFCLLMSRAPEEILGKTDFDFNPAVLAQKYQQDDQMVLRTGENFQEVEELEPTGKPRCVVQVLKTPVRNAAGEIIGVQGIFTDITSQRELEARFLRAQRLESLGSLASGIAHDLNNILTPIIMCAPLLQLEETAAGRSELIQTIESSAQRAVGIVKQLLGFARGKQGQKAALQLHHLMRDMAKIARETFPRNIQVEESCEPGLWPVVADATQLHQVLLNLCVNARDAMPEGGRLTLSACNVTLGEHPVSGQTAAAAGPYVCLRVRDTGTGIPESVREHVFESFFTTKGESGGSGLGLSTVLGIVRAHQGFIDFTSVPGRGTTFEVHLPAAAESQAPAHPQPPMETVRRGRGELVLVVDDEPSVLESIGRNLQRHGYAVLPARDGEEALAQFAARHAEIRAVVTDFMMPGMGGLLLCRTLRRLSPRLPVIVSSGGLLGKQDGAALRALEELGIRHIVPKPHTAQALLRTLGEVLAAPAGGQDGPS